MSRLPEVAGGFFRCFPALAAFCPDKLYLILPASVI